MGYLIKLIKWGARGAPPPIFPGELYIVWNFGGYMQVHTYKISLNGKF